MRLDQKKKGFTLIELLIVVAIIAILALIAVPNFLEAQTRSKISRVFADMRSVIIAMETYFSDFNGYPEHIDWNPAVPRASQRMWFDALTSPISYITSMPTDPFQFPFSTGGFGRTPWAGGYFHYDPINNTWDGIMGDTWGPWSGFVPEFRSKGFWYVLWSPGPDGDHDFAGTSGGGGQWGAPPGNNKGSAMACFYDATNGTVSSGDLIRLGPGSSDMLRF